MKNNRRCARPVEFKPLAVASAVALLLGGGGTAWAQTTYYTFSGNVSPVPVDPQVQVFNAAGPLSVASGAPGSFSALAGAQLSATTLSIANGSSLGNVVVDGSGTLATLTGTGSLAASITVGSNSGANGDLTVRAGGKLLVDNSGGPAGTGGFVNIGVNGGVGAVTVTGTGSSFDVPGFSGVIQAGRSGATGSGSFSVLAGATATATFLNIGRDGATGTVVLDGAGSQLALSGLGNYVPSGVGPAFLQVGWGGTAGLTISDGALLRITDGPAVDTSATGFGPGFQVGTVSGSNNGTGNVTITGPGSRMELVSTSISPTAGNPDNGNPFGAIGHSAGSTGTMTISNGGQLLMTGNALSTPDDTRTTYLGVGGYSDTVAGGTGTLTVTGAGSAVKVAGADAFVTIGRNGTGTVDLANGALFEATIINLGRASGGNGTLTMDASTINLSGQFTDAVGSGAGLTIGNRGGTGSMTMSTGSAVTITNLGSAGAGLNLGGTGPNPLGSGTLTMSGGSSITFVSQPGQSSASFGRDGTATATLSGASFIDLGTGTVHVGRLPTGIGSVTLNSGSKILAGVANIGGSSDIDAGGTGTLSVSGAGSELAISGPVAFVGVGRGGTGTLTVENGGTASAIAMSVGRNGGTGTLTVDNATLNLSGQQTGGNLVGANLVIGLGGDPGGLGGGTGTATIKGGSTVNITNYTATNNAGANLVLGGSTNYPQGNGTLDLSGASRINVLAASGAGGPTTLGGVIIGNNGSGTATLSSASVIDAGAGGVFVGRVAGGVGVLDILSGSKLMGGDINFGGQSDTVAAGNGTVTVRGAGSEIVASGDLARVLVGRGGTGSLTVDQGGAITAKNLTIGRAGGTGTFIADDATINLSGEQTGGFGAALSVGRGATGTAIINNSTVTISNGTASGAALNVGGTAVVPLGTGTLNLTGGTTVNINAAAGLGTFNVGYGGNGTANLSGPGTAVNVGNVTVSGYRDGNVYVGREAGSTGALNLSSGAVVSAGFVGVGVSSAGSGTTLGTAGGTGIVNLGQLGAEGTISAPRFELGVGSVLTGSGTIDAGPNGEVVIGGTIAPGSSPGRIRIRCDVTMLFGSQLILEIDSTGANVDIDQLLIGDDSNFDLTQLQIVFAFIGNTNPTTANLDLNQFLRAEAPDGATSSLETLFADGQDWGDVVTSSRFAFTSSVYDVTGFTFNEDGTITGVEASRIPEPATYALVLLALGLMARRQRRAAAARH